MRTLLRGALLSAMLFSGFLVVDAQQRGRGGPSGPPEPTPRLADGTVNLGRVAGEKGVWSVPYITNMGERIIEEDGSRSAPGHAVPWDERRAPKSTALICAARAGASPCSAGSRGR